MVHIIYLVIVLISMSKPVLVIIGLNRNMCPHTSQWSLRSTSLCNKSEPEYLCLFDDNENVYKEFCKKKSDTQRPGYEFVIRGELDDKECDKDRYQPIKLTTAGHSRCMFDKSKCSEEGQLVYDNGTIISDRLCKCDYTHSYSFVNASKNNCFCDPSTEDCSCYKMNCPDKLVLSPDYMCIELKKFPGNNNCQEIKRPEINIDVSNQEKGHFTIILPKVFASNRKVLTILFYTFSGAVSVIGLVYGYVYYLKGKRTEKCDKATKSKTDTTASETESLQSLEMPDTSCINHVKACSNGEKINRIMQEDKWQACALVLCIAFVDGFDINWLKPEPAPKDKKTKLQYILIECDVQLTDETSILTLKYAFTSLYDKYLTRTLTVYRIIDDKLYKQVALIYGHHYTECFIRHASSILIRDHFLFESIEEVIKENDDHIMVVRDKEDPYFGRLLRDLRHFNIKNTFQNKQLKYPSFVNKLIRYFERNEEAQKILKNLDINGRTVEKDDKNSSLSFASTPLIESASGGYVELVNFLIETIKSEVNNRDGKGRTALYKASEEGNINVVQLLLEKHADVNQYNMHKESPLYVACKGKHSAIVDILIHNNANVLQCTSSKKTALYAACAGGCYDTVRLLLEKNPDVDQCSDNGESPLFCACVLGFTDIVQILIQRGANLNQCNMENESPLFMACKLKHIAIVQMLLQNNACVSQYTKRKQSPMYAACKGGRVDIVNLLIKIDVDVNCYDENRESPLYVACERGYTDIVEALLQTDAEVNQCDIIGQSPLYISCAGGHTDIVHKLLAKGANANKCNNDEETPLYIACTGGHKDIVENLLQKNADVSKCDSDGKSPLHVACGGGYKEVVKMLLNAHANVNLYYSEQKEFPLYISCAGGYTDIVEMLLKKDANVSQCNSDEKSPLFVACTMGYAEIVELLLERDAEVSQCSSAGASPLYAACGRGRTDIVKLLLQKNPDILQCRRRDKSPLHVACDFDSFQHLRGNRSEYEKKVKDHIKIVELLISCNVDVNMMDSNNQTPLDIAIRSGCLEMVSLLGQISELNGDK